MEIISVGSQRSSIALSQAIAQLVIAKIHSIRRRKAHAHLAFEYTPNIKAAFQVLASSIYAEQLNWHKLHIYSLQPDKSIKKQMQTDLLTHVDFPSHHYHSSVTSDSHIDVVILEMIPVSKAPSAAYVIKLTD